MMWELASQVLAGAVLARGSYVASKGLYTCYIGSWLGRNTNIQKMGKWAVVTGATDGLGKAYALEMAKKNLNVVLISRSQDKLSNVSDEIASKYKVETRTIQADFTRNDIYDKIGKELKDLDIGVLVNNVGMTYDYPKEFSKVSEKHIHDLINCNIMSATMMSKLVLDGMQRRERGLIINMSSIVHLFPSPYLLVYASLKQFLVSFSKGLAEETKENNVTVQCVIPGIVTTKFSGARKTNLLITTPESYVTASLRSTGLEVCSYGHLTHRLQATTSNFFTKYVHESIVNNFTNGVYSNYRLKAIKRINKMAAKQKNVQEKVTEINEVSETATATASHV
ncbi:UNVERIFIED_CONTAM: hypothetical protein RMT77_018979 [Armadillidium vulgare]